MHGAAAKNKCTASREPPARVPPSPGGHRLPGANAEAVRCPWGDGCRCGVAQALGTSSGCLFFFFPFFFSSSSSSSSPTRWDPLSPKLKRGQRNARRNCNVVSALGGHTCSEKATAIERDPKIFSSDSVLSVPSLAGPWVRRQHPARGSGVLGEKKAEPPSGS